MVTAPGKVWRRPAEGHNTASIINNNNTSDRYYIYQNAHNSGRPLAQQQPYQQQLPVPQYGQQGERPQAHQLTGGSTQQREGREGFRAAQQSQQPEFGINSSSSNILQQTARIFLPTLHASTEPVIVETFQHGQNGQDSPRWNEQKNHRPFLPAHVQQQMVQSLPGMQEVPWFDYGELVQHDQYGPLQGLDVPTQLNDFDREFALLDDMGTKNTQLVSQDANAQEHQDQAMATVFVPAPHLNHSAEVYNGWRARAARDERTGLYTGRPRRAKGGYESLLLKAPAVVAEWRHAGIPLDDISRLLQYYISIAQLFTMDTVSDILQVRNEDIWLHELDHRISFQDSNGIPPDGWVPQMTWQSTDAQQQQSEYKKTPRNHELVTFPRSYEPLPIGITLEEMLESYPNHVRDEFLDAFIQHSVSGGQLYRSLNEQAYQLLCSTGSISVKSASVSMDNVMHKRMQARRKELKAYFKDAFPTASPEDLKGKWQEFSSGQIKIRAMGSLNDHRRSGLSRQAANANGVTTSAVQQVPALAAPNSGVAVPQQQPLSSGDWQHPHLYQRAAAPQTAVEAPKPGPANAVIPESHDQENYGHTILGSTREGAIDLADDSGIDLSTDQVMDEEAHAEELAQIIQEAQSNHPQIRREMLENEAAQLAESHAGLDASDLIKFIVPQAEKPEHRKRMDNCTDEDEIIALTIRPFVMKHPRATVMEKTSDAAIRAGIQFKKWLLAYGVGLSKRDREKTRGWNNSYSKDTLFMALKERREEWDKDEAASLARLSTPISSKGKKRVATEDVEDAEQRGSEKKRLRMGNNDAPRVVLPESQAEIKPVSSHNARKRNMDLAEGDLDQELQDASYARRKKLRLSSPDGPSAAFVPVDPIKGHTHSGEQVIAEGSRDSTGMPPQQQAETQAEEQSNDSVQPETEQSSKPMQELTDMTDEEFYAIVDQYYINPIEPWIQEAVDDAVEGTAFDLFGGFDPSAEVDQTEESPQRDLIELEKNPKQRHREEEDQMKPVLATDRNELEQPPAHETKESHMQPDSELIRQPQLENMDHNSPASFSSYLPRPRSPVGRDHEILLDDCFQPELFGEVLEPAR